MNAYKQFLLLLLMMICGSFGLLQAQDDDYVSPEEWAEVEVPIEEGFWGDTSHCPEAVPIAFSTIRMETGQVVFIRFSQVPDADPKVIWNGAEFTSYTMEKQNQNYLFSDLPLDKNLEFRLESNCAPTQTIGTLTAATEPDPDAESRERQLTVSPELFELLSEFPFAGMPLHDFMAADESLAYYEKIAAYQQMALRGRPLTFTEIDREEYPSIKGPPNDPDDDTDEDGGDGGNDAISCRCTEIRLTPLHFPLEEGPSNGFYAWDKENMLISFNGKIEIPKNARKWSRYGALGAAKWMGFHTEGLKSNKNQLKGGQLKAGDALFEKFPSEVRDRTAGSYGKLGLHLICLDGNTLPDDCSCNKPGTLSYLYDTKVSALAKLHSNGGGDKKSRSIAEDIAVVSCYEKTNKNETGVNVDNVVFIDALKAQVAAQCNLQVNPEFWTTIEEVGSNIIRLFTDENGQVYHWEYEKETRKDTISTTYDTLSTMPLVIDTMYQTRDTTIVVDSMRVVGIDSESSKYQALWSSLIALMTTSYYSPSECDNTDEAYMSMNGVFNFSLRPNKPLYFYLTSYGKLSSHGMRSWYAYGQAVSDYGLSAMTWPGKLDGAETECCAPYAATYLVGAPYGNPKDYDNVSRYIGQDLYLLGMNVGNPNGLNRPGFYYYVHGTTGYMYRAPSTAECKYVKVTGGERSDGKGIIPYSLTKQGNSLRIYDINGKFIVEKTIDPYLKHDFEIREVMKEVLNNQPTGFYIGQIYTSSDPQSIKFFNSLND